MWIHWLHVASEHQRAARGAREQTVSLASRAVPFGDETRAELHASMVGISASAHAIDALYGELQSLVSVPRALVHLGAESHSASSTHLRDAEDRLQARSETNSWPSQLKALYDLRDQVVHHKLAHQPPVPHPNGLPVNVAQEMADYCVENVGSAVELAVDVALTAIEAPGQPAVAEWATGFLPDWPPLLRALPSDM